MKLASQILLRVIVFFYYSTPKNYESGLRCLNHGYPRRRLDVFTSEVSRPSRGYSLFTTGIQINDSFLNDDTYGKCSPTDWILSMGWKNEKPWSRDHFTARLPLSLHRQLFKFLLRSGKVKKSLSGINKDVYNTRVKFLID